MASFFHGQGELLQDNSISEGVRLPSFNRENVIHYAQFVLPAEYRRDCRSRSRFDAMRKSLVSSSKDGRIVPTDLISSSAES